MNPPYVPRSQAFAKHFCLIPAAKSAYKRSSDESVSVHSTVSYDG